MNPDIWDIAAGAAPHSMPKSTKPRVVSTRKRRNMRLFTLIASLISLAITGICWAVITTARSIAALAANQDTPNGASIALLATALLAGALVCMANTHTDRNTRS